MAPRLWIDVEDLFEYAGRNLRPSGIQRLTFELYRTLQAQHGDSGLVHFVRHDPVRNSFRSVLWPEVATLFLGLTGEDRRPPTRVWAIQPRPPAWLLMRRLVHRLPPSVRMPLIETLRTQAGAWRAWGRLAGALAHGARRLPARLVLRQTGTPGPRSNDFINLFAPGDLLLVLGAPWSHPDYAGLIQTQRKRYGFRVVMLVYDLIPVRCPEWVGRGLTQMFKVWFDSVLPLCDFVFSISRATADDVTAYAHEQRIALPGAVMSLPIGTDFGSLPPATPSPRTPRLPPVGSYALFVSTIEARKNHALLFRVWRRLLREMPRGQVPTLVFAGRIGGLVDDLMRQIANTDYLDGMLMVVENPTDTELAALYQGCLFTLYPSLFEGWGLPVTESLAFGKPCLIADRTSLPEAGGSLARRFDPDNLHDAYAAIRDVIEDRIGLARWEAQVRREFRPIPWSATVEALLAGLEHPLANRGEGPTATVPMTPAVGMDAIR